MPIFESYCGGCKEKVEWYASNRDLPDPLCAICSMPTKRCVSGFSAAFAKNIADYGDRSLETYHKDQKNGGHWVMRKRSHGADETGVPIPEFITSVAQNRRYCRDEGLVPPDDVGNWSVDSSGEKSVSHAGEPGCW